MPLSHSVTDTLSTHKWCLNLKSTKTLSVWEIIGFRRRSETSVSNHLMQRNNPEEGRIHTCTISQVSQHFLLKVAKCISWPAMWNIQVSDYEHICLLRPLNFSSLSTQSAGPSETSYITNKDWGCLFWRSTKFSASQKQSSCLAPTITFNE